MNHSEEKQQDNIGAYTKEQTIVGESKSWRALTLALVKSYVSTNQEKKESQLKTY
jgi:hypothetical protein